MSGPRNLTIDQATEIVYEQFATGWATANPGNTPIAWQNKKFTPTLGTPYVTFQVIDLVTNVSTMGPPGTRVFQRKALALITVCVSSNENVQHALKLASNARAIFEGKSFGPGVDVMDAVGIQPLPKGGTDGWYKVVVKVPLTYYQTL